MRLHLSVVALHLFGVLGFAAAFQPRALSRCTTAILQPYLPAGASFENVTKVSSGRGFDEGTKNLGYPSPPYNPTNLPELCAAIVKVNSSATSSYRFGIYLPTTWNNRFLAVGNGGFAGGINWYDMASGTHYGFSVISTDTGHNSGVADGKWAYQNPERRTDWGWRAMHGSTVIGKALTNGFYQSNITYSYYTGCSTGGRQGLKEIQTFPDSFDGALIGAPGWYTSNGNPAVTKLATLNLPASDSKHIKQAALVGWYADAIRAQCDPVDGTTDGIVSDPEGCTIDTSKFRCGNSGVSTTNCLTDVQIQTTKNIYGDYKDSQTGALLYNGLSRGSEKQWATYVGDAAPSAFGTDYIRYFLYDNPNLNWTTYTDQVVYDAQRLNPGNATADVYDLSPFKNRGGKMIMYHGTADGIVATKGSNLYYDRVTAAMGDPRDFFRLFLIPGMQHCLGTEQGAPWAIGGAAQAGWLGHDQWSVPGYRDARHDALMALMDWTEKGTAVDSIIATTWNTCTSTACLITSGVLRQRPLCPWPQKAVRIGTDEKLATSWQCQ